MTLERQRTLMDVVRETSAENPTRWRKDTGGRWIMPDLQSEFLDWLLMLEDERPKDERTEQFWAATHGVTVETLKRWKMDARFKNEWTKRAAAKNISVDRLQQILDMLFRKAVVKDDANAATRWLSWVEKYMPPVKVQSTEDVAGMSDDELLAEIRELSADG